MWISAMGPMNTSSKVQSRTLDKTEGKIPECTVNVMQQPNWAIGLTMGHERLCLIVAFGTTTVESSTS
jgi:hypothetical protein